jgi:hypothetical protein
MNATEFNQLLVKLDACPDAVKWCEGKSLQDAWDSATRSDWMFWLLLNQSNEATDKELRLIAVKCARQVQHLMTDQRSINALDVAERFSNGEATEQDLAAARDASWDAARAAAGAAARAAARAAAGAAARAAARDASWDASWAAAGAAAGAKQSEIIREYIPVFKIKS